MDGNVANGLDQQEPTIDEWFRIFGHDKLKKRIIRPGWGERPVTGQLVTINCVGHIDAKTEIDKHDKVQIVLGDGDFIPAFDLCIHHMYNGEICEVFTDARYAYGLHGREPDVPGDVSVTYRIELVDIGDLPEFPLIPIHTVIQLCKKKMERAKTLTSRAEYLHAIFVYKKTLQIAGWWSTRFIHTSPPEEFRLLADITMQCSNLLVNVQMQCWEEYTRTLDTETVARQQMHMFNPFFPFSDPQMPQLLLEMERKLLQAWNEEAERSVIFRCLTSGPEEHRPIQGQLVTVKCVGFLEDGTQIDKHERLQLVLMDCEFVNGFDYCLSFMNKDDIFELNVHPQFAYGSIGREPDVAGNTNIKYIIQLLDIENQREFPMFTADHIIQLCNKKRERGNYFFKRNEFSRAVAAYSRSRQVAAWWYLKFAELPAEARKLSDVTVIANNNLAAAFIKIKLWDYGLQCCVGALALQPRNVKTLYRQALCLAGMGRFSQAIAILQIALKFKPGNKDIEMELSRVENRMTLQPTADLADITTDAKAINREIERIFRGGTTVSGKTIPVTSDDNQPDCLLLYSEPYRAIMPCGHVIGPQSLLEHIFQFTLNHLTNSSEVTCPACCVVWDFDIVCCVACLDTEEQHELERQLTKKYIWSKNVKTCKSCGAYVDLDGLCDATGCRMVRCPVCTKREGRIYDFCSGCTEEWKDGGGGGCGNATCKISNRSIYERLQANCDNMKDIGGVMCPAIRACPKCLALMEHVQNCRHVRCNMCVGGYWFCFVCLRPSGHYPEGGPFPENACSQPWECREAAQLQTPGNKSQNYP